MTNVFELVYWVVATLGQVEMVYWLFGAVIAAFAVSMVYKIFYGKGV